MKSSRSLLSSVLHTTSQKALPVIDIQKASFYKTFPSTAHQVANPPLLENVSFTLTSDKNSKQYWAVAGDGATRRAAFLEVLRGLHIAMPPTARNYQYLTSHDVEQLRNPLRAIQYVGFANRGVAAGAGTHSAYLSARYESRREKTDFSVIDHLKGNMSFNPSDEELQRIRYAGEDPVLKRVINDLDLQSLLGLPVGSLSNGQTRRARIAKALMDKPEVLLLDEPFAGLDPVNHETLSSLLFRLAEQSSPRIILSLQDTELLPSWITHMVYLSSHSDMEQGPKDLIQGLIQADRAYLAVEAATPKPRRWAKKELAREAKMTPELVSKARGEAGPGEPGVRHYAAVRKLMTGTRPEVYENMEFWDQVSDQQKAEDKKDCDTLVEMQGVQVSYGPKMVLGNWTQGRGNDQTPAEGLWWNVRRGQRWGIFGANGSGKTTVISLICSDHPQAYSLPIEIFGRSRLPSPGQPGLSIFDLQARIGHASPEVHTFFPKNLSLRQVIESAWAEAYYSKPMLNYVCDEQVNACLRWFRNDLDPAMADQEDYVEVMGRHEIDDGLSRMVVRNSAKSIEWLKYRAVMDDWLLDDHWWADELKFGELSFSAQRVALFLRAIIKKPDIVILDEAFSGMGEKARQKAMMFLAHGDTKLLRPPVGEFRFRPKIESALGKRGLAKVTGLEERQALICVSHRQEEVPFVVRQWMCLPEPNEGKNVRFGEIDRTKDWWHNVWGP